MRKIAVLATAVTIGAAFAAPTEARAFCGFYVAPNDAPLYADATMVALMREGNRTSLSMSNNYRGPAADFAMVVPVPVVLQKESVKTLPTTTFQKLEQLSAPRLVEYWEQDPCAFDNDDSDKKYEKSKKKSAAPAAAGGKAMDEEFKVKVEAEFTVGEYDIVVLSAEESDGLEKWLIANKYNIPKGASAALAPYIKEQMKFFVAKVDVKKVQMDKQGVTVLSPLRFHYESQDFRLPVRLGLLNAGSTKQDLLLFVLSKSDRYEVANFPNAFIPTNVDVADETRNQFGAFYAALFDATVAKAGGKAVVTEYAWTSAGCDPCPTPPLSDSDVATLGGDVLLGMAAPPPTEIPVAPPSASGVPSAAPSASVAPTVMGPKGKSKGFPNGPEGLLRRHVAPRDPDPPARPLRRDHAQRRPGVPHRVPGRRRPRVRHRQGQRVVEKGAAPARTATTTSRRATPSATSGRDRSAAASRGVASGAVRPTAEAKHRRPPSTSPPRRAAPVQARGLVKSRVDDVDLVPPTAAAQDMAGPRRGRLRAADHRRPAAARSPGAVARGASSPPSAPSPSPASSSPVESSTHEKVTRPHVVLACPRRRRRGSRGRRRRRRRSAASTSPRKTARSTTTPPWSR